MPYCASHALQIVIQGKVSVAKTQHVERAIVQDISSTSHHIASFGVQVALRLPAAK